MSEQETATQTAIAGESGSAPEETADELTESAEQTAENGSQPAKVDVKELIAERKKKQEARQEAAYLRGQLDAIKTPSRPIDNVVYTPRQDNPPVEPVSDNFDSWDEYQRALNRHLVDLAKYEIRQEEHTKVVKSRQQTVQQAFWEKVDKVEGVTDFKETVNKVGGMVNPVIADLVVASDVGIDLVRYFDKYPDEAKRLTKLPPVLAAKEIGKIESRLENQPKLVTAKRVSLAPEPIKTVKASSSGTVDIDKLPMDQWVKRRNEEQFKQKRK